MPTQVSYQKGGGQGHDTEVDQFVLACQEPDQAESKLPKNIWHVSISFAFRKCIFTTNKKCKEG